MPEQEGAAGRRETRAGLVFTLPSIITTLRRAAASWVCMAGGCTAWDVARRCPHSPKGKLHFPEATFMGVLAGGNSADIVRWK